MERKLEEITHEALQMSVESRATLAKRLLDNLDELTPESTSGYGWRKQPGATGS